MQTKFSAKKMQNVALEENSGEITAPWTFFGLKKNSSLNETSFRQNDNFPALNEISFLFNN